MGFKAEVKQRFLGKVNGVEINDQAMYYSTIFTLDILDDYEIKYNDEIIREIYYSIERIWMKTDMPLGEIEHDIYDAISATNRFPTDYGYRFETLNEMLDKLQEQ